MDLRDLLSILRARWIGIVAAALIGGLIALGASLLVTPTYRAQVQFYVTVSAGDSASAAYQGSLGAQQRMESYAALVSSTDIAREVASATDIGLEAADIARKASATADASTVLLTVSISDTSPQRAYEIAEGYAAVLPGVISRLETPEDGGSALAKLTVVNPPELPSAPVAPRTEQNIAVGLVVGMLLGTGIVLLISVLDRRVKTASEAEELANAPVIGAIPFRKDEDKDSSDEHIVPFREGHSPAAEAFRRLRTNLQFLKVDNPPKVFVITSSVAMEGKSETAVNLSLALAEAGNSVLLVEADLRRPRVVTYMSMPDKVGLTNILTGQAGFDDVVQQTRHDGVDLLACGPLPPNPSELLASEATRGLFESLRKKYDYVLIDSPPLLPVTDGALMARISDGAILVIRSDRTTSDQVAQAVDNLGKTDATLLGLVIVANKPAKRGTASYYDSYYYSSKSPSNV
ncbi:polysaccharide biosynthesis tyrosine autokinase [Dietzia maris]